MQDDRLWLAKGRNDWWDECRITPKQFDRSIRVLEDKNLIERKTFAFCKNKYTHIWLNVDILMEYLADPSIVGDDPLMDNFDAVCIPDVVDIPDAHLDEGGVLPKGEGGYSRMGDKGIPQRATQTKNTTKINTKDMDKSSPVMSSHRDRAKQDGTGQDGIHSKIINLKDEKRFLKLSREIETLKTGLAKLTESEEKNDTKDRDVEKLEFYESLIKTNVNYGWTCRMYSHNETFVELMGVFIEIMASVMCSRKKHFRIGEEDIGQAVISKRFSMATQAHLYHAVSQYIKYSVRHHIKHPKSYIISCIYNSTYEQLPKDLTVVEYF